MSYDVLVTGRSIPALQTALECAELGLRVCVTSDALDHEPPRAPLTDPEGTVRAFLHRVATPIAGSDAAACAAALPSESAAPQRMVRDANGAWAPLAQPSVLGIPATPLDAAVLRIIGTKAAFRAYTDRIRPVLTVGKTKEMATLVQHRMGQTVLDVLVSPELVDTYGVPAAEIDVAIAAPGLNEALTRQGSLSTAVLAYAERHDARQTRVAPAGGGDALKTELLRKLALYTAELTDAALTAAERRDDGWLITLSDGTELDARSLVVDAARSAARTPLVAQLAPELSVPRTRVIARSAVLAPEGVPAGSDVILQTAGWSMRVHVRADGEATATVSSEVREGAPVDGAVDAADLSACERALRDVGLTPAADASWEAGVAAAPFATAAQRDRAATEVAAVSERDPLLLLVGRSLAGDDLGSALRSAEQGTVRLRRRLLGLID